MGFSKKELVCLLKTCATSPFWDTSWQADRKREKEKKKFKIHLYYCKQFQKKTFSSHEIKIGTFLEGAIEFSHYPEFLIRRQ